MLSNRKTTVTQDVAPPPPAAQTVSPLRLGSLEGSAPSAAVEVLLPRATYAPLVQFAF
jgi:hypothetical protein